MKICFLSVVLALSFAGRATAADAPPTEVVQIDHAKMEAAFAKGMPVLANTSYKLRAGRRVGLGTVEVHPHDTDIFYVTEGGATIVTGGTPVNPKKAANGEVTAEKISGGVTRQLTKGDVLVVPAGVPHWFTETSGTFLYFLVKVTK